MTGTMKRVALGIGAAVMAVGLAGGTCLAAQGGSGGGRGRFGGPGSPGDMRRGGPMGPGGLLGPGFNRLDLSDAQKERVKGIMDSHREDMRALGEREMKARQALNAATSAETFDESTVRTKAAEVAAVEADLAVMRARVFAEVYQILTPDQQQKLQEFQAQMKERGPRGANRPPRP